MRLESGPFVVGDAEVDAVANPSPGHDHVVAKGALLGSADAHQRLPRSGVERVGLELHPDAAQGLEGVPLRYCGRYVCSSAVEDV